ncbi:CRISPR system precrRNA processing endoribonuclease RAMP protein Cas6 [Geobacter sp.]|uniref:CRISPR system precrRNA processing endoribonuclease RAMP protein Cas6 n=1 Tax=Geobacter sp. TaxID=46610 RepID=UPI0027B8C736|nr:CRISPR system precrRNA processing endoribonuclease RAMP protein Cas6 [Geobacter sp.]
MDAVRLLFDKHTKKNELSAVVERVESLGYHDEPTLIYSEGSPRENADSLNLLTAEGLRDARLLDNAPAMRLRLVTPLKLMQEGRTMRHFSFSPFIRTLIRRASSLASYYCDDGIPADYRWLTSLSEAVRVSKCTIRWVEWGGSQGGGKLAGLAGEAILTSMPEEFIPFLLLGELFNVGKGAPFGLGRFTVAAEEP